MGLAAGEVRGLIDLSRYPLKIVASTFKVSLAPIEGRRGRCETAAAPALSLVRLLANQPSLPLHKPAGKTMTKIAFALSALTLLGLAAVPSSSARARLRHQPLLLRLLGRAKVFCFGRLPAASAALFISVAVASKTPLKPAPPERKCPE